MPKEINGYLVSDKDLVQRYVGNYIQILGDGKEKPEVIYVRNIDNGLFHIQSEEENFKEVPCAAFKIVKEFPEPGAVNHKKDVHVISRMPERQWTRGLNPGVLSDFCRCGLSFHDMGLTREAAKDCFERYWINEEEGFPKLRAGELTSFARDTTHWYSGNKKHIYLWRHQAVMGEVLGKRLFFFPKSTILKQELKDDLGERYEIV